MLKSKTEGKLFLLIKHKKEPSNFDIEEKHNDKKYELCFLLKHLTKLYMYCQNMQKIQIKHLFRIESKIPFEFHFIMLASKYNHLL